METESRWLSPSRSYKKERGDEREREWQNTFPYGLIYFLLLGQVLRSSDGRYGVGHGEKDQRASSASCLACPLV